MPIEEKISQEDIILWEIVRHPVLCGEFIRNIDKVKWEEEFKYDYYQKEMLCDFNSFVSISTARAVGKTVVLVSLIIWCLINNIFPEDYLVYTIPNKAHLQPVWEGLVRDFRSNSFLKNFINQAKGINASDFRIILLNHARLFCRIAGQTGTGAPVVGLHSPFEMVDESFYYPWGTFVEFGPTLNTFTQGYRKIIAGVPTGLREKCVGYVCDMQDSSYTKHRVSAMENPRFTEEDNQRAIEQYGGVDSEDYIHLILGQHGTPVFAVFDRRLFEIDNNPVYKLTINGIKLKDNIEEYIIRLSIFPKAPENDGIIFGIDLGYTDPSAIIILYLKKGRLRFHGRIKLLKVPYPIQEKIIDFLDTKFNPSVIGVDEGHAGIHVVQTLLGADEFIHKEYNKRLVPINFSSQLILGKDADGEDIKSKTRPFSVSVLQEYSNNHKLIYSSVDLELITELERMTYSKNPAGYIIYKTMTPKGGKRGEDHFTSALLCATLAYYLENESLSFERKSAKLFQPQWI